MKTKYFAVGLITTVLVIFAIGADNSTSNSTQWEYAQLTVVPATQTYSFSEGEKPFNLSKAEMAHLVGSTIKNFSNLDCFNYYGEDGWELFEFDNKNEFSQSYYFKRPKQ